MHYTLKRSPKRKSITIVVSPKNGVVVNAPQKTSEKYINELVLQKEPWILKKLSFFKSLESEMPSKDYKNGDTVLFLGERLVLSISVSAKKGIYKQDNKLFIESQLPNDRITIKHIIDDWYLENALSIIHTRAVEVFKAFNIYSLPTPKIVVTRMRGKWGQCSAQSDIKLNRELIKTPIHCIDYVIYHEFCHLLEHNHGPKFYRLLQKHVPNWKIVKKELAVYSVISID